MPHEEFNYSNALADKFLAFYSGIYSHWLNYQTWDRIPGQDKRQLQGIDVIVFTPKGNFSIEEKAFDITRNKGYKDICLELWHEYPNGSQSTGWIYRKTENDYFCFTWPYQKFAILIKTNILISWFTANEKGLIKTGRVYPTYSSNKTTYNLFLDRKEFIRQINGECQVIFRDKEKIARNVTGNSYLLFWSDERTDK